MYDRRLDAVIAAAELGSFSQAAERLHVSTPALVKQVSGFEAEVGVTLFERSHAGVSLTAAGQLLVDDARSIIRRSDEAVRRAQGADGTVRLGISLMCPGRKTLELWPRVHELDPELRLEIVPMGDLYDARGTVMTRLGKEIDVVQSSYSTARWGGACGLMQLFTSQFCVDVPRGTKLAALREVNLSDLAGTRIRVLKHGNDAMDFMRETLRTKAGAEVIDVASFDFALFNDAEQKGDAVLTSGAWSGMHPGFVTVPIASEQRVPCFLVYPPNPVPRVQRFVAAMRQVLAAEASRQAISPQA